MEKKSVTTVEAFECPYCGSLFPLGDPVAGTCLNQCFAAVQTAKFRIGQLVMASKSPRAFFGKPTVLRIVDVVTIRDSLSAVPAYVCENEQGLAGSMPCPEAWLTLAEKDLCRTQELDVLR